MTNTTIKMLSDCLGSPDGINVVKYEKDLIYTVSIDLAKVFVLKLNAAVFYKEEKAIPKAPQNKAEFPDKNKNIGLDLDEKSGMPVIKSFPKEDVKSLDLEDEAEKGLPKKFRGRPRK